MLSKVLKITYKDSELPIEEWQLQAIVQLLGLSITEEDSSLKMTYFSKDEVAKRLKKMGVLVTPEQYEQIIRRFNHEK